MAILVQVHDSCILFNYVTFLISFSMFVMQQIFYDKSYYKYMQFKKNIYILYFFDALGSLHVLKTCVKAQKPVCFFPPPATVLTKQQKAALIISAILYQ